ncbi:type II toxin-antitoxin system RelE/ParE family toxin [Azospirillum fermentarium]|uniref:type II toxin-antitoxin system RelE/ParE family toxin n=1 Tax=Azospirillum fermentarium TaxID=1233114 RepID=UPI002225E45E|nr:type II toxin-antitoxin system RelE/ParE family toxin [Azospirillum fermentarium]
MVWKVTPSPAALRDLDAIQRWLLQPGSGVTARAKLRRLINSIRQLEHTPERWPAGDHPGVREIPVEGCRVMYEVHSGMITAQGVAGTVRILRVFGPGQDRSAL